MGYVFPKHTILLYEQYVSRQNLSWGSFALVCC